jgi:ribonuclease BN (tRNA processing enzyme)
VANRFNRAFVSLVTLAAAIYSIAGNAAEVPAAPAPLELVVLGSGGPGATGRAASSYLVLIDGVARILVDAGPGAFARLGEAHLSLSATDIVLLTHLHIDHVGELPGLFKARAVSAAQPITFRIWGPAGSDPKTQGAYFPSTTRLLQLLFGKRGAFAYLSDFSAPMTLEAHDIAVQLQTPPAPHVILKDDGIVIRAIAGHHRDAPAVIYRIDYAGKSITFSGDIDAQGLPDLRVLAQGTDLLVFNSVVLDPPGSPSVLYTLHTPPHAIGEVARDAGVHNLLMSHLSPAVEAMRKQVSQSIQQSYAGSVSFADDGMHIRP